MAPWKGLLAGALQIGSGREARAGATLNPSLGQADGCPSPTHPLHSFLLILTVPPTPCKVTLPPSLTWLPPNYPPFSAFLETSCLPVTLRIKSRVFSLLKPTPILLLQPQGPPAAPSVCPALSYVCTCAAVCHSLLLFLRPPTAQQSVNTCQHVIDSAPALGYPPSLRCSCKGLAELPPVKKWSVSHPPSPGGVLTCVSQ